MPLATRFIGGVLPALLWSLIRKRAGYMKFNLWLIQLEVEAGILICGKLQAPSLTAAQG